MLYARKALFLRRRDYLPVYNQTCRRVMVIGGDSKNICHKTSLPTLTTAVFIFVNRGFEEDQHCACVAQTVQFAFLGRWAIYRSSANCTVCATQAAVSYFIQSTHSSEKPL